MLLDGKTKDQIRAASRARLDKAQREWSKEHLFLEMVPDVLIEGLRFVHTEHGYYCDGELHYEPRTIEQVAAHMTLLPPVPVSMSKGSFRSFAPTERIDDRFREVRNMVDTGPTARAVVTDIAPFFVRYGDRQTTVEWWANVEQMGLYKIRVTVVPPVPIPVKEWSRFPEEGRRPIKWEAPYQTFVRGGQSFGFNSGRSPMYVTVWANGTTWADALNEEAR